MVPILQMSFFQYHFLKENACDLSQISYFAWEGTVYTDSLLAKVMVCCWFGNTSISEAMLTTFYDAIWHNYIVMTLCVHGSFAVHSI